MLYPKQNEGKCDIQLNINGDCARYRGTPTAFLPMNFPEKWYAGFKQFLSEHTDFVEGSPWFQGDHSLFLQNGCPSIAIASQWFLENMESHDVRHTAEDTPKIVDC